jgi:hypothetical protein
MMAWSEAQRRTYSQTSAQRYVCDIGPWPRDWLDMSHNGPSREYYRILDRAAQGFIAGKVARRLGMLGDSYTVTV